MRSYALPVQRNSPNMGERLGCLINSNKLQQPKHHWTVNTNTNTNQLRMQIQAQLQIQLVQLTKYGRTTQLLDKLQ